MKKRCYHYCSKRRYSAIRGNTLGGTLVDAFAVQLARNASFRRSAAGPPTYVNHWRLNAKGERSLSPVAMHP